ncbi:MAG: hypothetical protein IKQ39_06325, partial [Oscillospiraceae bacterium]|nr:hypothetical protein [Oscillospiraceae bacterium]
MKKFISALSSLVIAATALGGTLAATPATAAINGNVDKTIFDIRSSKASSDNPNLVEAKAGDQIPYVVYIPQSSGFYLANLKFAINGDATKGQDPALCNDATKYTLKKDTQLGNKGEVIVHPEVFGNYGIKLAMNFCNPGCFVSGYMNENSMNAGKLKAQSAAIASGENWSSLIMSQKYLDEGKNLDSFNKFASEGGEQAMEDETAEEALYAKYQPAFTWTKDESWAYDYGYVEGTLTLPDNLPDGVYTFDVYTGGYIASQFLEDFKTYNEATGDYVDDPMNGKLNYVYTSLTDVDSKSVDFTSVPLKIKVGDTTETTTSTTGTTTTTSRGTSTSSSSKIDPSSGIVYDLVPAEGEYELKNGNNVVKVAKGATVTVNWIVNNDAEAVGGMEYTLDVSKVASVANTKVGKAYSAEPLINTDNAGEIVYTFSTMESLHAKDGAVIMKMDVTVPD